MTIVRLAKIGFAILIYFQRKNTSGRPRKTGSIRLDEPGPQIYRYRLKAIQQSGLQRYTTS
jgi:hypothetical protein